VSGDLLQVALTKLAAARERPYLDEDADREAADGYYGEVEPDFEALSALVESTHRQRPGYSPATELYPLVDLQPDGKLRSLYTEEVWEPEELIEEAVEIESQRATLRASATGEARVEEMLAYNCEHVVPQSWFDHDEPMRGDLHHLFTCERKCNSFRGNTPFTDFADYLQVVRESCGKSEGSGFEPWRGKGPAARATLYFTLRYPRLGRYSEETLGPLLAWHDADPPGEYERHRNAAIHERQGNRNPLVDHPEWAAEIAFAEGL
jgi:endonuclease G, mitochondrial